MLLRFFLWLYGFAVVRFCGAKLRKNKNKKKKSHRKLIFPQDFLLYI